MPPKVQDSHYILVMVVNELLPCVSIATYDNVIYIGVSKFHSTQDKIHHPLENRWGIFQSHRHYLPLVGALGGRHAGYVPGVRVDRNLVKTIPQIQNCPNLKIFLAFAKCHLS